MAYLPCQNPACKSNGAPHPNCECYKHIHGNEKNRIMREDPSIQFPGTTRGMTRRKKRGGGYKYMAKGGEVGSDHFCDSGMSHLPSCEYFAQGGPVASEVPQETHDHSAAYHGLHGMLSAGDSKLKDPDQHKGTLSNIHQEFPEEGHPLVGNIGKENLHSLMPNLIKNSKGKEPHPEAFRSSVDYLNSAIKGKDKLSSKINSLFKKTDTEKIDESVRSSLKDRVNDLSANPQKMLELGGNLGHYMPAQNAQLAESVSNAVQYLSSMKPQGSQAGPLDPVMPPTRWDEIKYNRALDIASDPTLVIDYAKNGLLEAQDIQTLHALYPKLAQSITQKATEFLIDKGIDDSKLTRAQKRSFSALIGQPLTFTQGPEAIRAIMQANSDAKTTTQDQGPKKATGVELKQINKVNQNSATPLQQRQLDRK